MKASELPFVEFDVEHQDVDRAERDVAAAREQYGIVRSQRAIEALSWDAAADLMRDLRFKQFHELGATMLGIPEGDSAYYAIANNLTNIEGEVHHRQRKAVAAWFTAERAEQLRAMVRAWLVEQMDEHDGGDVLDFKAVVGTRLPATVYCWIVGAPLSDVDYIAEMSEGILAINNANVPDPTPVREIFVKATLEGSEYIRTLLEEKHRHPGDDLTSAMLQGKGNESVTDQDVVDVLYTILGASTDTTNCQMCLNLAALADHPDQWQVLKRQPQHLANASMELMRFRPGLWSLGRRPMEPLTWREIELTPDDLLYSDVFSANRDPKFFEDPLRLDVARKVPRMPLGFGNGRHNCVGRFISLVEQQEAIRVLLERWSEFEVQDGSFVGAPDIQSPTSFTLRFARAVAAVA